jgi:hypothetical protein
MKELFDFTVTLPKEVDLTETKEENGQTITITKKVTEEVPHRVIFKQPSRRDIEESDLQFSIELSNCVKKGILTKGMLLKKYSDTGGLSSDNDTQKLNAIYADIAKLQQAYILMKAEDGTSSEEKDSLLERIAALRKQAVDLETAYLSFFNNTADTIAQNIVIRWFCLNMTHKQINGGVIEPMFKGSTYEQKLDHLSELEENADPLFTKVYTKLITFISFWYFSKTVSKEDFKKLDEDIAAGKFN